MTSLRSRLTAAALAAALTTTATALTPGAGFDPTRPLTLWTFDQLNGRVERMETTTSEGVNYTKYDPAGLTSVTITSRGREINNRLFVSRNTIITYPGSGQNTYTRTGCNVTTDFEFQNTFRKRTCDQQGRAVTTTWTTSVMAPNYRYVHTDHFRKTTYSADGRVVTSVTTSTDRDTGRSDVTEKTLSTYAMNGLLILHDVERGAQRTISRYDYTFDAQGNWLTRVRSDVVGGQYVPAETVRRSFSYY